MIIGFSQRSRTEVESDAMFVLVVHSLRLSELDYEIQLRYMPYSSTATVGSINITLAPGQYDAAFGT